jgi:drug/metabolite transporter (DMT)-like permease
LGLVTGNKIVKEVKLFKHFFVIAFVLNSFPFLMFAIGQQYISSSLAGILNATTPLFAYFFLAAVFKTEKVRSNQILGLFIGFFGVYLLMNASEIHSENSLIGVLIILAATLGYGFSFPYSRKFLLNSGHSPISLASTQLLFASLMLLPLSFFNQIFKTDIETISLISILILGVFGTGFAYVWNFQIIERAGSTIASTVTYITPLVATFAGLVILSEKANLLQFLGGVAVLLSAALVQRRIKVLRESNF